MCLQVDGSRDPSEGPKSLLGQPITDIKVATSTPRFVYDDGEPYWEAAVGPKGVVVSFGSSFFASARYLLYKRDPQQKPILSLAVQPDRPEGIKGHVWYAVKEGTTEYSFPGGAKIFYLKAHADDKQ